MQRLRVQYAKRGRARFASHRDFSRAFERALRRAGIPMAFTSGFTPHPRISYANAAPTGAASEAEYLELGLAQAKDPSWVRDRLNEAMPDGLVIVKVVEAASGALAERLAASDWLVELPGSDPAHVEAAIHELLASQDFQVQRMTKSGLRSFDVRAAILRLEPSATGFELVSKVGEPLVRPDDVMNAIAQIQPSLAAVIPVLYTRLAQGLWDGTTVRDPLAD